MKLLITGYKGFIGQNMVKYFTGKGHEVIGVEFGDRIILDGVDYCIHLGAISSTTCTDTRALLQQNCYYTGDLMDMCNYKSIPMSFASSASVYGIRQKTFRETDDPEPSNFYAWSKVMAEEYMWMGDFKIPIHIFRYFNVYGDYEDHKGNQASPYYQFRKQAQETGVIKVFEGSEGFYRDFVPVEYLMEVQEKFLDYTGSGIWNIGTGKPKSFMEVAKEIARETGSRIEVIPFPEHLKSHYQSYTCANTDKLNRTLDRM